MHRVLSLLIIFLFLIEVLFHLKSGKAGRVAQSPVDSGEIGNSFDRFDLLRLLELLCMGLLFSTSAGSTSTGQGQLTVILVGMQTARLIGRRILSRWSVLGVIQVFEMALLLSILLMPVKLPQHVYQLAPVPLLALLGGVVFGISVSIAAAFSFSYGVRLFSGEHSHLYNAFPPLAGSEGWAYRFSLSSLPAGVAGSAGLFFLCGFSVLPVLFTVSVLIQSAGVIICGKKTFNGHHPIAHILWGISFLVLYIAIITGITTVTPPS
jgi:hypothetical protein